MDTKAIFKETILALFIAALIGICISFFIKPVIVREDSMLPTFQDRDYTLVNRTAYSSGENPEYGDVIVFKSELDGGELLIKRVIGEGGDTLVIKGGNVYRNGKLLHEDYLEKGTITETENGTPLTITVPKDKTFVMGDNREVSIDSRYDDVGLVSENDITGRVFLRIMRISGRMPHPDIERF